MGLPTIVAPSRIPISCSDICMCKLPAISLIFSKVVALSLHFPSFSLQIVECHIVGKEKSPEGRADHIWAWVIKKRIDPRVFT